MSAARLSMKKGKEILRLKHECRWGNRKIAASCNVSKSTVTDYVRRARRKGLTSWEEIYDVYLGLLLDVLERIDLRTVNPALLSYLGDALNRVGLYIDPKEKPGNAYAATRTWLSSHTRIAGELKRELKSYAQAYDRLGLDSMLTHVGI